MWRVKNRIGFNWVLVQTKVYQPFIYIKKCLIIEDQEVIKYKNTEEDLSKHHNIYNKYIKMRKFGVPEEALKIELKKNNLSYQDFIKYKPIKKSINDISVKKAINQIPIKKPMINAFMLKGIKLKKPKKRKKQLKPKKNILTNIYTKNYRPPTREVLAELIKNLKKQPL